MDGAHRQGFPTPVVLLHSFKDSFVTSQPRFHSTRFPVFCQIYIRFLATTMFASLSFLLSLSSALPLAYAAPVPLFGLNFGSGQVANGTPSTVSANTVNSTLLRPAQFARVAYCSPASVTALSCGAPCDPINGIKVLTAGGDEGATPRCKCQRIYLSSENSV